MFEDLQSVSLFGVFVALLILHFLYSSFYSQETQEPPGPRPVPLFGNLFQMDLRRLNQSLFDLSKKYGPVFQVYFGSQKVVVLSGYRTIKQALVNHANEFGDREIAPASFDLTKDLGIVFSNGDLWKEMRRFALTTLRDFGMGKKRSEDIIVEECQYVINEFEQLEGKASDNTKFFNYAATNIVSVLMFGKRFDYKDQVFRAMVERDNELIRLLGTASISVYNCFPWLGPFLKDWRDYIKHVKASREDVKQIIADLKETLDPEVCRCFVDAFLIRKKQLEDSESENSHFNDDNLLYSVINLIEAGNDTTANTLKWSLLYMAKYPHVQDRVQEELSRVVGSRQVQSEDRKNLPYTDAVIHETQRFADLVPLALPHTTCQDVTLQGYFIKKVNRSLQSFFFFGTTVFPLLTSVLYDESEWESPHSFNPSHFLDDEGKFIRRDAFMPFSAGTLQTIIIIDRFQCFYRKDYVSALAIQNPYRGPYLTLPAGRRACLGEGLARMELFLFFTSLLQRFRFTPPPGVSGDEVDLTPVVGLTLSPRPQKLCVVQRK
nr:cytochrome P450 2K4-like [Kryptolebias hermaphroditus]